MFKTIRKYIGYLKQIGMWNYKYLGMMDFTKTGYNENSVFIERLYEVAYAIADKHSLPIVNIPYDELNKNETDKDKKAVGMFTYRSSTAETIKTEKKLSCFFTPKTETAIDESGNVIVIPRVILTEKADIFVLIHELGHFDRYLKGKQQSEDDADFYLFNFLKDNFPPFFMWVFQTSIKVMCKVKIEFTDWEAYNHYINAKKFLEQWNHTKN